LAVILAFFDYSPRNVGGSILGLGGTTPYRTGKLSGYVCSFRARCAHLPHQPFEHDVIYHVGAAVELIDHYSPATLIETNAPGAAQTDFPHRLFSAGSHFVGGRGGDVGIYFHAQYGILNDV
jgi:hypothetical protein